MTCPESKVVAASSLSDRFALTGKVVYRGLACTVFLAVERDTLLQVVVKVLLKANFNSEEELRNAKSEIDIHADMPPHRNVLHLLAMEETDAAILLVMPFTPHGDLWSLTQFSQTYCEEQVRNCAAQMLSSLRHTHAAGILHCDIKPHNFLLVQAEGKYSVQLCDFGLAARLEKDCTLPHQGFRGTSGWFSPEMHAGSSYGQPIDMFAAGLILFRMLGGYEPYYPANNFGAPVEFDDSCWCHISEPCKDLMLRLLSPDPQKRISAADACEHPWIAGPAPPEPTPEQLQTISDFGSLPKTDVLFWPPAAVPTRDRQSFHAKPEELLALPEVVA